MKAFISAILYTLLLLPITHCSSPKGKRQASSGNIKNSSYTPKDNTLHSKTTPKNTSKDKTNTIEASISSSEVLDASEWHNSKRGKDTSNDKNSEDSDTLSMDSTSKGSTGKGDWQSGNQEPGVKGDPGQSARPKPTPTEEPKPEPTATINEPEPTPETTPEPTPEPTPEATPEPTPNPTPVPTPECVEPDMPDPYTVDVDRRPGALRDIVQAKAEESGGQAIPAGVFRQTVNAHGGGFVWNPGTDDLDTLNKVCDILGYLEVLDTTCLDDERSGIYPKGKCNFHTPHDDNLIHWDASTNSWVVPHVPNNKKYTFTWLTSITCGTPKTVCPSSP